MSTAADRSFSKPPHSDSAVEELSNTVASDLSFNDSTVPVNLFQADVANNQDSLTPSYNQDVNAAPLRVRVEGKFLYKGLSKFYLKGTTYGTFSHNENDELFPTISVVDKDFSSMAASNINVVRVYTIPPRWLLDLAQSHGLCVLVGIPWEQHLAFLDDNAVQDRIVAACEEALNACRDHPAVLGYSLGNEIKGHVVRWLGRKRVEKFLERLYRIVKNQDQNALVTYVNFPTTEYLDLSFLDFISFNVYLEKQNDLEAYLARLQRVAGDKPLVMAEIGLDSRRNGEFLQATSLNWQLKSIYEQGCAGVFVYAWTDEWHTNGHAIKDWDFGLTTRDRKAKPALSSVKKSFKDTPFASENNLPKMSVIVCSYNGADTIAETICAIHKLNYPDFELIVIDDGSTDDTATIARTLKANVISTPNKGLSSARNTGWQMSSGEIIVYCDDDAYPNADWLHFIAILFRSNSVGAAGGPNLAPNNDGFIADCVNGAPGGPNEVLLSDSRAEHIPGCNLSVRRSVMEQIGGFDEQFCSAGDDVDLCWRILDCGHEIGFHSGAMNWHHRRNTIKGYLSQQRGYGHAEALLARKWPDKYNAMGHIDWQGVIYGKGVPKSLGMLRNRIYSGIWGTAPFQRLYQRKESSITNLLLIPETLLLYVLLLPLAIAGIWLNSLKIAPIAFVVVTAALIIQAVINAYPSVKNTSKIGGSNRSKFIKQLLLTSALHLIQPIYRLTGRLGHGLTPLYKLSMLNVKSAFSLKNALPPLKGEFWDGRNATSESRLSSVYHQFQQSGLNISNEDSYSSWDMKLAIIPFGSVKFKILVEEYGESIELLKYRFKPIVSRTGILALAASLFCTGLGFMQANYYLSTFGIMVFLTVGLVAYFGINLGIREVEWVLRQECVNSDTHSATDS